MVLMNMSHDSNDFLLGTDKDFVKRYAKFFPEQKCAKCIIFAAMTSLTLFKTVALYFFFNCSSDTVLFITKTLSS